MDNRPQRNNQRSKSGRNPSSFAAGSIPFKMIKGDKAFKAAWFASFMLKGLPPSDWLLYFLASNTRCTAASEVLRTSLGSAMVTEATLPFLFCCVVSSSASAFLPSSSRAAQAPSKVMVVLETLIDDSDHFHHLPLLSSNLATMVLTSSNFFIKPRVVK